MAIDFFFQIFPILHDPPTERCAFLIDIRSFRWIRPKKNTKVMTGQNSLSKRIYGSYPLVIQHSHWKWKKMMLIDDFLSYKPPFSLITSGFLQPADQPFPGQGGNINARAMFEVCLQYQNRVSWMGRGALWETWE